ncbi:MAG TPA: LptF/LptG family permease [Gemmatimonadota bacterium]|nr:LptF/LptG family permease [Gemmatimonadota bacterium]
MTVVRRWGELVNARTLSWYAFREHVGPFLFALVVFTFIMLMNQVARQLQNLAGKGLGAGVILEVFLLSVPLTIAVTIPMSVLVATMAAFGRLAGDNEVTAMQANGVGFHQIIAPSLLGAIALTVLSIGLNDTLLPESNHRLTRLMMDIQRTRPTVVLQEKRINDPTGLGEYRIIPDEIDHETNLMYGLRIVDMTNLQEQSTILADSGRLDYAPNGEDAVLTLWHGSVHHRDVTQPQEYEVLQFTTQRLVIRGVGSRLERAQEMTALRSDREMDLEALMGHVRAEEAKVRVARIDLLGAVHAHVATLLADTFAVGTADSAGAAALRMQNPLDQERYRVNVVQRLHEGIDYSERQRNKYLVEYHKKFSIPFACIVFVLIGAPIGVRARRGGYGFAMGMSTLVFVFYYLALTGGEDLADRRILQPWVAMWLSNLVFGAFGLWLLRRTARETAARGQWLPAPLRRIRAWRDRRRPADEPTPASQA